MNTSLNLPLFLLCNIMTIALAYRRVFIGLIYFFCDSYDESVQAIDLLSS